MRSLLLASSLLVMPVAVLAEPQCPLPPQPEAPSAPSTPAGVDVPEASPVPPAMGLAMNPPTVPFDTVDGSKLADAPVLAHIVSAGAHLTDLGASHGMRTVLAHSGEQLMVFEVAPDGQVAVSGLMADLSASQLLTAGGDRVTELDTRHGLRTLFVRSGTQFQVFYVTPDGERVIPGVLWDASGKDLTREQVASVAGAIPTIVIGPDTALDRSPVQSPRPATLNSSLASIKAATAGTAGTAGSASAPQLWMFIDPMCGFSVRAMQQLQPFLASGRVRLSVIPISLLDTEDGGRSTAEALAMVSKPADQMVAAWTSGQLTGTAAPDAQAKLEVNTMAAHAIGLRGTPTFLWRKADGTEGRADGLPADVRTIIASLGS